MLAPKSANPPIRTRSNRTWPHNSLVNTKYRCMDMNILFVQLHLHLPGTRSSIYPTTIPHNESDARTWDLYNTPPVCFIATKNMAVPFLLFIFDAILWMSACLEFIHLIKTSNAPVGVLRLRSSGMLILQ
ncbi:hypothetical protein EJ08DRAFT_97337 [Tothia fuscella]|uniref:Uncharacterized protein n=1 Tax=Tothia fuscella TaxID=1048955 RepID=A0A9P4NE73_9PEZI|nr:hypothetical protein EJ08DRAFT_97337 [Tothia fuscella]